METEKKTRLDFKGFKYYTNKLLNLFKLTDLKIDTVESNLLDSIEQVKLVATDNLSAAESRLLDSIEEVQDYVDILESSVEEKVNELTDNDDVLLEGLVNLEDAINSLPHPYVYRGTVDDLDSLYDIAEPKIGDVYNLASNGLNYAWTGEEWDSLGGNVDLSSINNELDVANNKLTMLNNSILTCKKLVNDILLCNKIVPINIFESIFLVPTKYNCTKDIVYYQNNLYVKLSEDYIVLDVQLFGQLYLNYIPLDDNNLNKKIPIIFTYEGQEYKLAPMSTSVVTEIVGLGLAESRQILNEIISNNILLEIKGDHKNFYYYNSDSKTLEPFLNESEISSVFIDTYNTNIINPEENNQQLLRLNGNSVYYPKQCDLTIDNLFFCNPNTTALLVPLVDLYVGLNLNSENILIVSYIDYSGTARQYRVAGNEDWKYTTFAQKSGDSVAIYLYSFNNSSFNLNILPPFNINNTTKQVASDYDETSYTIEWFDSDDNIIDSTTIITPFVSSGTPVEDAFELGQIVECSGSDVHCIYITRNYGVLRLHLGKSSFTIYDRSSWGQLAEQKYVEQIEGKVDINSNNIIDIQEQVSENIENIEEINNKLGDVQIFDKTVLPKANESLLKNIIRKDNTLYNCISAGEFEKTGGNFNGLTASTNAITTSNYSLIQSYLGDKLELTSASYIYKDTDALKFGSSSQYGRILLDYIVKSKPLKLSFDVKPWANKFVLVYICVANKEGTWDYDDAVVIEGNEYQTLTYEFDENIGNDIFFDIRTQEYSRYNADTDKYVYADKRMYLRSIFVESGRKRYEWKLIEAYKPLTYVNYINSRMNYALPIEGTTVLIDNAYMTGRWGLYRLDESNCDVTRSYVYNDLDRCWVEIYDEVIAGQSEYELRYNKGELPWPEWCIDRKLLARIKPTARKLMSFDFYGLGCPSILSDDGGGYEAVINGGSSFTFFPNTGYLAPNTHISALSTPTVDIYTKIAPIDLSFANGDIVLFHNKTWNKIATLKNGSTIHVNYQNLEVTRLGHSFKIDNYELILPPFKIKKLISLTSFVEAHYPDIYVSDVINLYLKQYPYLHKYVDRLKIKTAINKNKRNRRSVYSYNLHTLGRPFFKQRNKTCYLDGYIVLTKHKNVFCKRRLTRYGRKSNKKEECFIRYVEVSNRVYFRLTYALKMDDYRGTYISYRI